MLNTDLNGAIQEMKSNRTIHLILLILACIIVYMLLNKYVFANDGKSNFGNIMYLYGVPPGNGNNCKGDIPKIDEAIIRNMIELPNRDPKMLTTSMVIPEPKVSQEEQKQYRLEVLNMFYNSFDDDLIDIKKRPQGLYLTP